MTDSVLATALAFATRGIGSFPCQWPIFSDDGKVVCCSCGRLCGRDIGKHPIGRLAPKGCRSATTDTGILKHWFGYVVPDANLAIHTEGLIVVDTDPRHGGDESFAALIKEHGELQHTWRVISGGGGHHDYFSAPDSVVVKNVVAEHYKPPQQPPLGAGIDVRATGGYVITPPSWHASGRRYAWSVDHHPKDTPLAVAPTWLVERLMGSAAPRGFSGGSDDRADLAALVEQEIGEYADNACARIAGHLAAHHIDRRVIIGLMQCWNGMKVRPPKLRWGQVERICNSVCGKEANKMEARERDLAAQEAALQRQEQIIKHNEELAR